LGELLQETAAQADAHGSVVLAGGDLDATYGNGQFRALLTGGYRDAAEQVGAGWTATYPAGSVVPPVVGIDHVLVRSAGVDAVCTVSLPRTDHRGLVVRVALDGGQADAATRPPVARRVGSADEGRVG
jgi:endonuclease/exonuclease/phosphatase (EEP) superfamily protein YafD